MATMSSPYKYASDSPSRQLLYELSRLGISRQEDFYARLDKENLEREALHKDALAAAAIAHQRVRRGAEIEREKLALRLEAERRLKEEESRRELEKKRQEKADREAAEKREIERARLAEAEIEAKRVADLQKAEAAAAEREKRDREQKDLETARRLKEQQDAQLEEEKEKQVKKEAKEAASKAEREAQLAITAVQPSEDPERDAEHQRYLEIHRNLKELRKFLTAEAIKTPQIKQHMGDMRREIKKSVGQLTEGKGANKSPLASILAVLRKSMQLNEPRVDVTLFLATPSSSLPAVDTSAPALLIYLLNIFSKAIISQFMDEAGISPRIADPIGTIASHIFSLAEFHWEGMSLIDILIAKMHVVCPILWGIYGDETTAQGKARIGWWREEKNGPWISEHRHKERMTGLGAGFAALALRNYEKARMENPYPNTKYWQSLSYIINTPPTEVTTTHFVILKAMIEHYESKFLDIFGDAAVFALRKALVDFPERATRQGMAAKALSTLVEVLRKEKKLIL